jgi:hypothetical protein
MNPNDLFAVPVDLLKRARDEISFYFLTSKPSDTCTTILGDLEVAIREATRVKQCTCPSGDGSLRWPCPVHPPKPAAIRVLDERAAFETFIAERFGDLIDRRRALNGDNEYMSWDMAVAWIVWQPRASLLATVPALGAEYDGLGALPRPTLDDLSKYGSDYAGFEKWMTEVAKVITGSSDPYTQELERRFWKIWEDCQLDECKLTPPGWGPYAVWRRHKPTSADKDGDA